jgi:tryptophan synthase beta subunit
MKITAKTRTQVRGFGIVHPNETIDIDKARIDERIKANFTRADGCKWGEVGGESSSSKEEENPSSSSDSKKQLIQRTAERMGREAIISALDSAHITYKATETTKSLAKKYLRSIGEDVD